jgi:hypothetical protein
MGFRIKIIQFPNSMTADEYETLLNDNGLIYEPSEYKTQRIEADIEKYKGKLVKIGYHSHDNIVQSYGVKSVTAEERKKKTDKQ